LKAIARSPEVREAFHVHGYDAGWQLAQERLFRQKFPLGLRGVDQNNVGGAIFRIGANDFERFLYTLRERRVFRIIDGDGKFINPAVFLEKKPQRKGVRKIRQDVIRSKRGIEPVPAALQRFGQRWENAQVPRPEKVSVLPLNFPIQQLLANLLTRISPNTLAPVAVSNPVPRG